MPKNFHPVLKLHWIFDTTDYINQIFLRTELNFQHSQVNINICYPLWFLDSIEWPRAIENFMTKGWWNSPTRAWKILAFWKNLIEVKMFKKYNTMTRAMCGAHPPSQTRLITFHWTCTIYSKPFLFFLTRDPKQVQLLFCLYNADANLKDEYFYFLWHDL